MQHVRLLCPPAENLELGEREMATPPADEAHSMPIFIGSSVAFSHRRTRLALYLHPHINSAVMSDGWRKVRLRRLARNEACEVWSFSIDCFLDCRYEVDI